MGAGNFQKNSKKEGLTMKKNYDKRQPSSLLTKTQQITENYVEAARMRIDTYHRIPFS